MNLEAPSSASSSKILREVRSGQVRGTVWVDEQGRKSVNLVRLYKDAEGKWQRTSSFKPRDLLDLVAVCLELNRFLRLEDRWNGLSRREGRIHRVDR